jgi:hypothetical protein
VTLRPAAAGTALLAFLLVLSAPGPSRAGEEAPKAVDVEAAIRRGVAYLVKAQNKDGSWGSPASNLWDIYAPVPGSYYAFAVASSALATSALLEVGAGQPGVDGAIRKATDYLLEKHAVRRVTTDTLYNTWALAYALETFARLLAREKDEARRAALGKAAASTVDYLRRYEFVDGGWGYYDFDTHTQTPGPGATSFTTATVLVALRMAADQGVDVPKRLTERGLRLLKACAKPDGSFTYDFDLRFVPQMGVNKIKGSLARTPACLEALADWGEKVAPEKRAQAFENLERYGHFLRIARKYPIPHETWYQNSGYFCFYGYYYASRMLERLAPEARPLQQDRIAGHLVPLQEEDGSWWDYQLYGYHKAYGTGYVLLVLGKCRR